MFDLTLNFSAFVFLWFQAPPHSRSCGYFQPIKKVGMAEMSFSETMHSQYRR